ncbi:MAG: glycoside hydrolase family 2 [Bacteroidales bacterium]|nr:glycoside hydrolase family 2 [Bacteroidales bacterium]
MKLISLTFAFLIICSNLCAITQNNENPNRPEFSIAGFYSLENSGRFVYNFNVGWRFKKGFVKNGESLVLDDTDWEVISTPHTVELMPAEASGSRNYQGPVWYRKHFVVDEFLKGKKVNIYFEAAMGKSIVFLNGKKVLEHYGGYLPFSIELTEHGVKPGEKCLIAVLVDNSDDRSYPPGKKQTTLDFAYHGGIYRDVWMIATADVFITDPNKVNKVGSGGVFIKQDKVSKDNAQISICVDIENAKLIDEKVTVIHDILDMQGNTVKSIKSNLSIPSRKSLISQQRVKIDSPYLWSPDNPYLYKVETRIISSKGKPLDGGMVRVGLRKPEFKGKEGFWLNGEYFGKLIGGNRHQDFAYVGNAVPNSQHWKDAKKLRDAGCRIIRVAHYPQDPSFMDACDELGLFVIVATPGWQFWNNDQVFIDRVYSDIRNMIRRDRNHASILMWEPILNETRFPLEFSLKAHQITHEEYPNSVSVGDHHSAGIADNYEVVYGWPKDVGNFEQCIFTREFAENVDDWYAHNTNNRVSRSWGELPQIVQSLQLTKAYNEMCIPNPQFIGGALWHPFDHQRGYHPDPYWGGLFDAFRQEKYSYYLFKSQVDAKLNHPMSDTGPMVFIAHEITPYSNTDVVVFTNCDEVRLIVYETDTIVKKVPRERYDMPNPPVIFQDIFSFNDMRVYPYVEKNWRKVSFVAEGLIDGKVVCSTKKMPSRRSTKLQLRLDNVGQALIADGSDFIPVICEVTDDDGNIKRLAKENILFTVEGEGEIIGDAYIGANPRAIEFGSAPVLIRSTLVPGKIKVKARVLFEGEHAPTPAEIEFQSIKPSMPLNYLDRPTPSRITNINLNFYERQMTDEERQKVLDEVEIQQTDFGKN